MIDRPMIIIIFGLPGSGKSFFASKLAEKMGYQYLNSDEIRLSIFSRREYSKAEKSQVYSVMLEKTETLIQQNEDIVLDATFYKKDIREKFIRLSKRYGRSLLFIEVVAEESIIRQRLKKERAFSEADYSVYLAIKASFEPLNDTHLVLESTQENINEMIDLAIDYIRKSDGNRADQ